MNTFDTAYHQYVARKRLKPKTRQLHEIAHRHFSRLLGRPPELTDFNDDTLSRYIQHRLESGTAADTVRGESNKLMALWRFCHTIGLLQRGPTIDPVKTPKRTPKAWTKDDLDKLFAAAFREPDVGSHSGPLYWTALLSVLWDTGERIAAALELEHSNIDFATPAILFPAESRKGSDADNWKNISPETAKLLTHLDDPQPLAFPYTTSTLYRRLNRILKRAGLPTDRKSKFHRIRKSTASHYTAAGGDAQRLLGHSSRHVTETYLDPRIVKAPSAPELLFRPKTPEHQLRLPFD